MYLRENWENFGCYNTIPVTRYDRCMLAARFTTSRAGIDGDYVSIQFRRSQRRVFNQQLEGTGYTDYDAPGCRIACLRAAQTSHNHS